MFANIRFKGGQMIRHISIFTLKNKEEKEGLIARLEEVGNNCSLIVRFQVGAHIGEKPPVGLEGPHFGDVVQIIDFLTEEDAKMYPMSKEHLDLFKYGPKMEEVTVIEFKSKY